MFQVSSLYGTKIRHINVEGMNNLPASNLTNISQATTMPVPVNVGYIIAIIFISITCAFTVVLNVLVIMAVKAKPRLQSYANVLPAFLALTEVLTGLLVQPTFIIWRI